MDHGPSIVRHCFACGKVSVLPFCKSGFLYVGGTLYHKSYNVLGLYLGPSFLEARKSTLVDGVSSIAGHRLAMALATCEVLNWFEMQRPVPKVETPSFSLYTCIYTYIFIHIYIYICIHIHIHTYR